jgi:hypothetical protein
MQLAGVANLDIAKATAEPHRQSYVYTNMTSAEIQKMYQQGRMIFAREGVPDAKPKREFPRLCRGGSKSLTYPGIDSRDPPTRLHREPPSTRNGVRSMDDYESLSHTKWECKYWPSKKKAGSRRAIFSRITCIC